MSLENKHALAFGSPKQPNELDSQAFKSLNLQLKEIHTQIVTIYDKAAPDSSHHDPKALCLQILEHLKHIKTLNG